VAKYGNFIYGGALYGVTPKLAYSVDPMSITVLDFSKVELTWNNPKGNFTKIKLVRNQFGFPETSEDGITIWEEYATEGNVSRSEFVDGEDNPTQIPIVTGRQVYYEMFLFTELKVWVSAGRITDLMPSNHGVHKRLMDIIPKVFTSDIQSPLGVTNEESHLSKFMNGIAFTHEQFLSQLDVLRPQHSSEGIAYSTLNQNFLTLGLTPEPSIPVKNQKRLIREANYIYRNKGTALGVGTYAESLTGFAPTITVSPNLLLSVQDSTFYKSVGNWYINTPHLLTSSLEQTASPGANVIDESYSGKIVSNGNGVMTLGADAPITRGVPITPNTEYTLSCKLKSPGSDGNIQIEAQFFDRHGVTLGVLETSSVVAATGVWKSASVTFTTPEEACYSSVSIYYGTGTYYVDQVCFQLGDTVAYDEARAFSLFLDSSKINLIKNPSFEVTGSSNWTVTGATFATDIFVPTDGYAGDNSGKFVVATTGSIKTNYNIPVIAGKYYTFSFYAASEDSSAVTGVIELYDIADTLIETFETEVAITDAFSRATFTALTDSVSEVSYAKVKVAFNDPGTYYVDLIQFEKSQVATEYFDGSLPSEYGAVWEGGANDSYSHLYPNKPLKIPRLGKTLNDWITPNTFWRLSTHGGEEYNNLTV
jgi:ribosomal protein L24E